MAQADTLFGLTGHLNGHLTQQTKTFTGALQTSAGLPDTHTTFMHHLSHGITAFLFEGTPDYPAQDRWWQMIENHGITILYGTPTAVRMFMKFGEAMG